MSGLLIKTAQCTRCLIDAIQTCTFKELEIPDSMTSEMQSLLEGLLQRDVQDRIGCRGGG